MSNERKQPYLLVFRGKYGIDNMVMLEEYPDGLGIEPFIIPVGFNEQSEASDYTSKREGVRLYYITTNQEYANINDIKNIQGKVEIYKALQNVRKVAAVQDAKQEQELMARVAAEMMRHPSMFSPSNYIGPAIGGK